MNFRIRSFLAEVRAPKDRQLLAFLHVAGAEDHGTRYINDGHPTTLLEFWCLSA